MIILTNNAQPIPRLEPGTPIVAVNRAGQPVAVGAALGADPQQWPQDLERFGSLAMQHSKEVGKYANIVSTGLGVATEYLPDHADALGGAATAVTFVATGLSWVNEIGKDEGGHPIVAGFKFGASALALIDEVVMPGVPALHISAQACKILSVVADAPVFNKSPDAKG
jgi:hypothetical protein